MIPWHKCLGEQVFSHVDEVGVTRHFAVQRLFNYMAGTGTPLELTDITEQDVQYCLTSRGVEMDRVLRLKPWHLDIPLLFADWSELAGQEGAIPIDGAHRIVRAFIEKRATLQAYVAPRKLWERFLLDIPLSYTHESVQQGWSGVGVFDQPPTISL
jgi:hypothetical protein